MEKLAANVDQTKLEHDVLKFWDDQKIFKKLQEKNAGGPRFRFLDGPITANNKMGAHHCWGRTLKDVAHRYRAMNGFNAQYQNGFDAQGMWVEVNVEKELGLNGKPQIEQYGVANFTEKCIERVRHFAALQTEQSKRLGQWMDWDNSYFTNSDTNILSIWHFLKVCAERNMLDVRSRPMAWCPRCGTSLSEHEMTGSYKDVTHTAIFAKLPVLENGKPCGSKILVWTTTPWTLSANVAIAVNPKNTYVRARIKSDDACIIVGKEAIKVLKDDLVKIEEEFLGEKLIGKTYETCFPNFKLQNFEHKIIAWNDVDAKEGSGAVHIAPGCGEEDFELGQKYNLPQICPINDSGEMLEDYGFLSGCKTTDVAESVIEDLKKQNKIYHSHAYKHSYPHCWRCKTDLVYKLIKTWYIKIDGVRADLLKAIQKVAFQPDYAGKRMEDWLRNMGDWNISRARYYGLPLPFYVCDCGHLHVVGSIDELRSLAVNKDAVDKLPHLHRPYIDEIKIKCPKCGKDANRVPEVGDCWLDAGITPFSTKKYFTDKKYFKQNFPSEFVCEMIEQVKLWFYSCLVMSVVLEGKAPYERVCTFAYALDENGNEFHKSGGNSLDADVVADKMGADFMRYLFAGAPVTNDMRFGYHLGEEARRKFLGFYNAAMFFNTYAELDKPNVNTAIDVNNLCASDKFILSRVNEFVRTARANYEDFKSYLIIKDFEKLTDDLTNWYIRINRKRFWKSENAQDKRDAYAVLFYVIKTITQVLAPIMPFSTEFIWQNVVRTYEVNAAESVHLSNFPKVQKNFVNAAIAEETALVRNVVEMGQVLRNASGVKIKQPLKAMFVCTQNVKERAAIESQKETILDELNVKLCEFEKDASRFNDVRLVLNFKLAGAVLKSDVQKVKMLLEQMSHTQMQKLANAFAAGKKVTVGEFKNLSKELFEIKFVAKKDYLVETQNNLTVALDITIDENLMHEGLARELMRTMQVLRKEAGFEIADRIYAAFETKSKMLALVIKKHEDKIKQEVLVKEIENKLDNASLVKKCEIGDEDIIIYLKK